MRCYSDVSFNMKWTEIVDNFNWSKLKRALTMILGCQCGNNLSEKCIDMFPSV